MENQKYSDEQDQNGSCAKCQSRPELIVSLECGHMYCFVCLTFVAVKRRSQGGKHDEVICPKCQNLSRLDEPTLKSIETCLEDLKEKLDPVEEEDQYSCIGNTDQELSEPCIEEEGIQADSQSYLPDSRNKPTPKTNNDFQSSSRYNRLNHQLHLLTNPKNHSEEPSFEHITPSTKYFFSKCDSPSEKPRQHNYCELHPFEQPNLVCLTCDNSFLCLKCVLSKRHSNHNVMSLQKSMDYLMEQFGFRRLEVNEKMEMLQIKQKRIVEHKEALFEKVSETKKHISQSLNEIVVRIRKRQAELHDQCQTAFKNIQRVMAGDLEQIKRRIFNLKAFKYDYKRLCEITQEKKNLGANRIEQRQEYVLAGQFFKLFRKLNQNLQENLTEEDQYNLHKAYLPDFNDKRRTDVKHKYPSVTSSYNWDIVLEEVRVFDAIESIAKIRVKHAETDKFKEHQRSKRHSRNPAYDKPDTKYYSPDLSVSSSRAPKNDEQAVFKRVSHIKEKLKTENCEYTDKVLKTEPKGGHSLSKYFIHKSRSPETANYQQDTLLHKVKSARELPQYISKFLEKNQETSNYIPSPNSGSHVIERKSKEYQLSMVLKSDKYQYREQTPKHSFANVNESRSRNGRMERKTTNPLQSLKTQKFIFENKKCKVIRNEFF